MLLRKQTFLFRTLHAEAPSGAQALLDTPHLACWATFVRARNREEAVATLAEFGHTNIDPCKLLMPAHPGAG
ncbi:hypothetical protein ACX80Z_15870 [Arthrobacter sp. TMT4-20]